jgi:ribosomal protein S18 acetylase RimI-like enzyme
VPPWTLRPAAPDDAAAIVAFWASAAENDDRPADRVEAVTTLIARDPGALWVAERDGAILGTVIAGWDGWRAHLYRLAVHPAARRQGLGRALLTAAEDRLADLGAPRLDAMVLDDNALGRSLWEATGYTRQDRWRRWTKRP